MATNARLLRTERTKLRRKPDRGIYDRETVNAILDEAFVCHLAFVCDHQPYALPTIYGRDGDRLLVHGSHASRMIRTLANGVRVCFTATLIDGLVLARSARMHSVNYRSVIILGTAKELSNAREKSVALNSIMEHVMPGRWQEVRPPNENELKETSLLEIPINEGSAKLRSGPPLHSTLDSDLRVWSGEVPLKTIAWEPVPDPRGVQGLPIPPYLQEYLRKWAPR
jgi:nitroimidazol reductase NimA-like FMN-containing flavoprotein (pyridoxamine 5'-phosphate oxidase superfamily)